MFAQFKSSDLAKIDVLESKFEIYEELSKEMLAKLEKAVQKIGDANNAIANILTKHDEKIEQALKTDDYLVKMIEGVKEDNKTDHEKVLKRIDGLESQLSDMTKFRWLIAGGIILLTFLISQPHTVVDFLTPEQPSVKVEGK